MQWKSLFCYHMILVPRSQNPVSQMIDPFCFPVLESLSAASLLSSSNEFPELRGVSEEPKIHPAVPAASLHTEGKVVPMSSASAISDSTTAVLKSNIGFCPCL